MVGVRMLEPESSSRSFPKVPHAQTRKLDVIKHTRVRRADPLHPRAAQGACASLHRNPAPSTNFQGRFSMV